MQDARQIILAIDDDRIFIELIALALDGPEYRTVMAPDAAAGLQLARTFPPVLILCDWSMPHVGGTELLEILRADVRTAHIPFVLMTGFPVPCPPPSGLDGLLHKPFCAQELRTLVRTLTASLALAH